MDIVKEVTEAQIKALKAQYVDIFVIEVLDNEDKPVIAYLKKPTRQTLSAVMSKLSSDPIQANEILLRNCIIKDYSDMRIIDNDECFMSAISSLSELIQIKQSSIKKI